MSLELAGAAPASRWAETIALYRAEAQRSPSPRRALRHWMEIGRIYEEHLGDPQAALDAFAQAREADVQHVAPLRCLRRLATAENDWPRLKSLINDEIALTRDERTRAGLYLQLGTLLGERLESPAEARRALREAAALAPDDPEILIRLELVIPESDAQARVEVLGRRLRLTEDPSARVSILLEMARLAESVLDSDLDALALHRETLRLRPDTPDAIDGVVRIHLRRGRVEALVSELVALTSRPMNDELRGRVIYLCAVLSIAQLHDVERAPHLLNQAAMLLTGDKTVLRELIADYESLGLWGAANALLEVLAGATTPEDAAAAFYRAGINAESGLGNTQLALDCHHKALRLCPGFLPSLASVRRIAWKNLDIEVYVQSTVDAAHRCRDQSIRAELLTHAGEVVEATSGLADAGVPLFCEAIEAHLATADLLPDVRALQSLRSIWQGRENAANLASMLERWLGHDLTADARRAALSALALLHETQLDDVRAAIRNWQALLDVRPDDLRALRSLQRLHQIQGDAHGLVAATEREWSLLEDVPRRLALLLRNAETFDELGEPRRAEDCWRRALVLEPRFLPALMGLGRLLYQHGRWHDLAALYQHELAHLDSEDLERVAILSRLAEVHEFRLEQLDDAASCYEEVLALRPHAPDALAGLERLYGLRDRHADLARVLRARADTSEDLRERALLLFRLGEIAHDHFGDDEGALDDYDTALEMQPALVPAVWALERVAIARGDRERLVVLYRTLLSRSDPGVRRSILIHKLAALLSPTEARAAFQLLAEDDPDDTTALWALYRDAAERDDRGESAERLARLAQLAGDRRDAMVLWREAAENADEAGLPIDQRVALWERLVALEPANARGWEGLHTLLSTAGDGDDWAHFLLRIARMTDDDRATSITRWTAGMIFDRLGGQDPKVLYREAAQHSPEDPVPVWLLLDAADRAGRSVEAADLRAELARRRLSDVAAAEELTLAGKALLEMTGQKEQALLCLLEAVRRDPRADEGAALAVGELTAQSRFTEVDELLQRRLKRLIVPAEALLVARQLMDLQLNVLGHRAAARVTLDHILMLDPSRYDERWLFVEMLTDAQAFETACEQLTLLLPLTENDDQRAQVYTRLGELRARHSGDFEGAVEALRAAVGLLDPGGRALEELAAVYLAKGDPGASLQAYERLERIVLEPERVTSAKAGQVRALTAAGRLTEARDRLDAHLNADGRHREFVVLRERLDQIDPRPATEDPLRTQASAAPLQLGRLQLREHFDEATLANTVNLPAPTDATDVEFRALVVPDLESPDRLEFAPQPRDMKTPDVLTLLPSPMPRRVDEGRLATSPGHPGAQAQARPPAVPPAGALGGSSSAQRARARLEADPLDVNAWRDLVVSAELAGQEPARAWFADACQWVEGGARSGAPFAARGALPYVARGALPEALRRPLLPPTLPSAVLQLLREVGPALTPPFCADAGRHGVTAADLIGDDDPLSSMARQIADTLDLGGFMVLRNPNRPYTVTVEAGDPSAVVLGSAVLDGSPDASKSFLLARCLVPLAEGTLLARKLTDREFGAFMGALLGVLGAELPVRPRDRSIYDRMRAQIELALPEARRTPALIDLARIAAVSLQSLPPASLRAALETYSARLAMALSDGSGGALEMLRRLDFDDRPRDALSRSDLVMLVTDSDVVRDLLTFATSPACVAIRVWLAGEGHPLSPAA